MAGQSVVVSVRMDADLEERLRHHARVAGISRSDACAQLVSEALLAREEGAFAGVIRLAVRDELARFLDTEQVRRAFAAEDFYERLAASVFSEMSDLRLIAGATLWLAGEVAARGMGDGDGEELVDKALGESYSVGV